MFSAGVRDAPEIDQGDRRAGKAEELGPGVPPQPSPTLSKAEALRTPPLIWASSSLERTVAS